MRCSLVLGAAAAPTGPRDLSGYTYSQYLVDFGKNRADDDVTMRAPIFEKNLAMIQDHNTLYLAGSQQWWMDVNDFADWTPAEMAKLTKKKPELSGRIPAQAAPLRAGSTPASVDWRAKGVETPVKNQGGCGSCWAFSATETMESRYAIATGNLVKLAPQAFVDCVQNPKECGGTGGCEGAVEELAFNLTAHQGQPLEADYPYTGEDGQCKQYTAAVTCEGFVKLPENDAGALQAALADGPVSVGVAASQWSFYGGGVFDGCTGTTGAIQNHGVSAVGYTPEYWIIRNSWGAGWGQDGYIYLSRAKDNVTTEDTDPADGSACKPYPKTQVVGGECAVLSDSSYPTGVKSASASVVV